jgi:tetratricopeptide (TPR) repeat protein
MFSLRTVILFCVLFSLMSLICNSRPAAGQDQSLSTEEQQQLLERSRELSRQTAPLYRKGSYREVKPLIEQALKIRIRVLGDNDLETATLHFNLAALLQTLKDYAGARPHYEAAVRIRRKLLGENHLDTAMSLNYLGESLQLMGDYAAARPYFEEALAINRKLPGEKQLDLERDLYNLGIVLISLRDYAAARPYLEESLAISKKASGENDPHTVQTLADLGELVQAMADYAAARQYFEQVLAIRRKVLGEDHPYTATSLVQLGFCLHWMGDYTAALRDFERALAIRMKVLGKDNAATAESLNALGFVLDAMGDRAAARPYYEQALAIRKKVLGENDSDTAASLNNLGFLLQGMGDYAAARPYFEQALAIIKKGLGEKHPDLEAAFLTNMGDLLRTMGDYAAARPYFEQALAIHKRILGEDHPNTATSLNNLGFLHEEMGDYAAARQYYEQTLAIRKKVLGENHHATANSLNNLGLLLDSMGEYAAARSYLEQALAIRQKTLGENHPDTAQSLNNLGTLFEATGDNPTARSYLEQALAIRKKALGQNHPDTADSYANLACLDALRGDWTAAARWSDDERRVKRRHVQRVLPGLSEQEQLTFLRRNDDGSFHRSLSLGLVRRDDSALISLSTGWIVNGKGVALESLAERERLSRDSKIPGLTELTQELRSVRSRLAKFSLSAAAPKDQSSYQQELNELAQREQELSRKLSAAAGETYRDDPWIAPDEVRQALPAEAVLVDIARFDVFDFAAKGKQPPWKPARYAAWIIPPAGHGELRLIDLGDANAIDGQIETLRKQLASVQGNDSALMKQGEPQAEVELRALFQKLAERIWKPLAPHLTQAKQLFLSPDGPLWLVPWGAIPVDKDKYLIEQVTINYLISGRELALASRGTGSSESWRPVLFANPNFDLLPDAVATAAKAVLRGAYQDEGEGQKSNDRSLLPRVARLPGTATEAAAIRPNVEKFTGRPPIVYQDIYALESVAKALNRPKVAIFSTHGFFLPDEQARPNDKTSQLATAGNETRGVSLTKEGKPFENPLLRCGLLFAGCNPRNEGQPGSGDDGVLTGMEIVGIDFRGTDLVVLSACETGVGTVNNGEGVAGLRQAFQLAGAEAVVATLWQIPDADSARLMNDFFANLAAGQAKGEALRNAQLKRIASRRERYGAAHPYFWAAYTITGR